MVTGATCPCPPTTTIPLKRLRPLHFILHLTIPTNMEAILHPTTIMAPRRIPVSPLQKAQSANALPRRATVVTGFLFFHVPFPFYQLIRSPSRAKGGVMELVCTSRSQFNSVLIGIFRTLRQLVRQPRHHHAFFNTDVSFVLVNGQTSSVAIQTSLVAVLRPRIQPARPSAETPVIHRTSTLAQIPTAMSIRLRHLLLVLDIPRRCLLLLLVRSSIMRSHITSLGVHPPFRAQLNTMPRGSACEPKTALRSYQVFLLSLSLCQWPPQA